MCNDNTLESYVGLKIDLHFFLFMLFKLEREGKIALYAGTYSFEKALELADYDPGCRFYFYTIPERAEYHFFANRMGASLERYEGILQSKNRYLYKKDRLSNCFWGESDCRSGEYFDILSTRNRS